MTKKFFLFIALVLAAGTAVAQSRVELGARAGVTSQDMELKWDNLKTGSSLGWHLAAVSRIRLTAVGSGMLGLGVFLQPEIVYGQNNYKMNLNGENGASKVKMQTVDVPVLLSVKVSIVRVQMGPVFNVMNKFETTKGDIMLDPQRPSVGYGLGASVDIFGGLTLDGRFHGEFKQLQNNISNGDSASESIKGSLSSWSLGLSWLF